MAFFKDELKKIRAFVFDVDGVLSRQEVSLSPEGELIRTSCAKDGYAIMYSGKKGYIRAVISGGGAPGLEERFRKLGIQDIYLKIENKVEALNELMEKYSLKPEEIMYMGDDIPDYNVMTMVGLPVCPADACEEIKSISRYISDMPGGMGCARDVISQVLKARGDWMDTTCYVKSM
ncbi:MULTISPECIES: KdsC family phosphatase [Culturomica]|jgi:3-deoxy-D-manno-octulosonate 8-phosphate phosphatase (KDO 8-P phosphatase)|uniref:KdsC family phosphatase n=1 Tax=Culturomica TaxID=1926651 RepID=UPI00033B4937|nr:MULTISPECIES: HAD hydrolase family protein [Odoribacteraceae]RHV98551.1 3-deoxy-D-manno-octulosonate 8-phosphate phosphatase [Odoribacter sp. OF09-27XD]CCZ06323.1 yrbI family 3-deoxy-D-manno-octulosonate 8-phosphate phosphatase [Odoribacter sp. CAG:788]HBO25965.1 3-deoxy-D-manno-octulosonate 8-phosphate phosphatase [Culturomica sp.]